MTNTNRLDPELGLLLRMRERLTSKGWTQFRIGEPNGPNCLVGAGLYETDWHWVGHPARERLHRLVDGSLFGGLVDFNNASTTGAEDVLELLDRAIAERTSELSAEAAA